VPRNYVTAFTGAESLMRESDEQSGRAPENSG